MNNFFRIIRQRLLRENRFSRYLLYAFGEIVLVVLGILIALQFNNLNEERKRQKEIAKLLTDIEQDLIQNYNQANDILPFFRMQDSIAKLIAYNKLTKEDYDNDHRLSYFVSNWDYYLPVEKNINQFVEAEKLLKPAFKPIVLALKSVQRRSLVLEDTWSNLEENIDQNMEFLTTLPWFVKFDSLSNADRMDFMLNDVKYQTLVTGYWARTQNYYDKITRYRAQTMATLATIRLVRDNFTSAEIDQLFQQYGMVPFVEYPITTERSELPSLKDLRASELYGNMTDETLNFHLTNNKGQKITRFKLGPMTLGSIPGTEYFGIDGDNNTLVSVLDDQGRCIRKYGAVENGYLLIDELF